MSVKQSELRQHFLDLGKKGALYVWGANGQIITKELTDKLYKTFGNGTYTKGYYNNKFKAGQGKPGADCSGSLYPVSGYDDTAAGYYNRCIRKGNIKNIPEKQVCLVFKRNSKGVINHVGCYTGDGYVSEMASSKLNYQRKKLKENGWDLWGMPDFVSDPNEDYVEQIEVDGEWGKDTTMKTQHVFGTVEDGKVSNQLVSCRQYLPMALTSSWEFKKKEFCGSGSRLIRAIQKFLEEKGYDAGGVDGQCGKNTVKAMQLFLIDLMLYKGSVNGMLNVATVKGWQQYINSRL